MLKHRYSSIRTKNRSQFNEGAQADAELVMYWDMEDLVDPGVQSVTPTTRTMANDIQENAFHAYFEDWEEALLTTSEADDSTARFRLATKYMGMVMFDAEMGEWRVVVDLGWTSKRAYGNKRLGFGLRACARPPRYRDCSRSRQGGHSRTVLHQRCHFCDQLSNPPHDNEDHRRRIWRRVKSYNSERKKDR